MSQSYVKELEEVRDRLLGHPLYKQMTNAERIKVLMKHHVFAVWDFMSLLKKLQQELTSVSVPWMPQPHPEYARFINEIVLGEETDEDGEGGYISHFELYYRAMEEVGADYSAMEEYLNSLKSGADPIEALGQSSIPGTAGDFVKHSLSLAMNGKPHEVAAAFFYGREDLIPDMFQTLVDEVEANGVDAHWLKYYLHRHIELDGDEHGPLAERLLLSLCGGDAVKLQEAERTAKEALEYRIKLWDGVLQEIEEKGL
ncbi:DUF3050 domain-containing protein [Fictibacillus aquaticus]|uniref:Antimetabolite toxin biosynthesis protein MgoB n=1 Tax=Fictibacillus aquaticus TaxID=2021314 RepID=A0A235F5I3_9BACL|nr:DUF3050 domain-containing protein [Fictibacillus aquaticus]OYD56482.1 antimetabolite toxin biosynthesis protein MgoB [Fictibacillus aquaticus]